MWRDEPGWCRYRTPGREMLQGQPCYPGFSHRGGSVLVKPYCFKLHPSQADKLIISLLWMPNSGLTQVDPHHPRPPAMAGGGEMLLIGRPANRSGAHNDRFLDQG